MPPTKTNRKAEENLMETTTVNATIACIVQPTEHKANTNILLQLRSPQVQFGNYWTLPGGKKNDNETSVRCLLREVKEETTLEITECEIAGKLSITHIISDIELSTNWQIDVYYCNKFIGTAKEDTLKGERLIWTELQSIPYNNMITDVPIWLPLILSKRFVECNIAYVNDKLITAHLQTSKRNLNHQI